MTFDRRKFLRQHGVPVNCVLTIPGHGTVTTKGCVDDGSLEAIVDHLATQEPARKIVSALAAMVANGPPTISRLQGLCQILAQQTPEEDLLRSLADLVAEENPHIYTLVDGQRPTRSALKILTDLA